MKGVLVSILAIMLCVSLSAQQTRESYLQKSRNQKTAGWIFVGGGGAMVIAGLVLISSNPSYFSGETVGGILIGGGAVAITGGIILFNASKRNSRKANEMSLKLNLEIERTAQIQNASFKTSYFPALSIKFGLK